MQLQTWLTFNCAHLRLNKGSSQIKNEEGEGEGEDVTMAGQTNNRER